MRALISNAYFGNIIAPPLVISKLCSVLSVTADEKDDFEFSYIPKLSSPGNVWMNRKQNPKCVRNDCRYILVLTYLVRSTGDGCVHFLFSILLRGKRKFRLRWREGGGEGISLQDLVNEIKFLICKRLRRRRGPRIPRSPRSPMFSVVVQQRENLKVYLNLIRCSETCFEMKMM